MAKSEKENAEAREEKELFAFIRTKFEEDNVELFLDSQLQPSVRIGNDPFQRDWSVDSQRFLDYLTTVQFELVDTCDGFPLKPAAQARFIALTREDCRKGGRRVSEAEEAEVEKSTLVQAVLCFMNERCVFEGRTADFLAVLIRIEQNGRVCGSGRIPRFTNIASRELTRKSAVFRNYGLELSIYHKEDGSYCRISKLPSFQKDDEAVQADGSPNPSSGLSSGESPAKPTRMGWSDDADDEIRMDKATDPQAEKGGQS